MNLKQLAKRVDAEIQPDEDGELNLLLSREWKCNTPRGLRRTTLEELEKLHERLSRAIPDDFDFWLCFENGKVSAELIYEDGIQNCMGMPLPVPLDTSVHANLRKLDWDGLRLDAINGNQLHDQIGDAAEELPSKIEPTARIHEDYRPVIDDYLLHVAEEKLDLVFLAADEENEEFSEVIVQGREHLAKGIGDCMTHGLVIVAVVSKGELRMALSLGRFRGF
jgi:hypothetical protein